MTHKLGEQIQEVRREIALREKNYPRWVSDGKLQQKNADYHLTCMKSVLHTLITVKSHQDVIRNAVRATKRVEGEEA